MATMAHHKKTSSVVRTVSKIKLNTRTIVGVAIIVAGASLLAAAGAFFSVKRVCKYPDGSYGRSCTMDYQCRISKLSMNGRCVYAPVSTRATQPLSKPTIIPKLVPPPQQAIPKSPLPIPPRPSIKK